MIDKEYLEQLKKEDYIAYDSLVNDPMVVGEESDDSSLIILIIMAILIIFGLVCYVLYP